MKTFLDTVVKIQKKLTAFMLLAMVIVVAIQVFARKFLMLATPWTEELAKYILIWIAFFGGMGALIKGEHLMVDIIYNMLSERLKRYARILNDLIFTSFSGFLLVFGIQLCINPVIIKSMSPAMQMPRIWLYICVPISTAFMVTYSVYDLVLAIKELLKKDDNMSGHHSGNNKVASPNIDLKKTEIEGRE